MLSLSYATPSDVPAIQQLMQLVFNDTLPFLKTLFNLKFNDNVLIYKGKNGIVAMAFLIPSSIRLNGKLKPITYIYACATHPDYRNRGLMHNILKKAWQEACVRQEFGIFLCPASDTLYNYYEKEGFHTFFYKDKLIVNFEKCKTIKNSYKLTPISADSYARWRMLWLQDDYIIHWDEAHLALVAMFPEFGEAGYYAFRNCEQIIAIAYIQHDNLRTIVAELIFCHTCHLENIYSTISQHFNTTNFVMYTQGGDIPAGMLKMNPALHLPHRVAGYMAFGIE